MISFMAYFYFIQFPFFSLPPSSPVTTSRKTNFFAASGTSLTFHTFNVSDPSSLSTSLKFGITSTNNVFNLTTWFSCKFITPYALPYMGTMPFCFSSSGDCRCVQSWLSREGIHPTRIARQQEPRWTQVSICICTGTRSNNIGVCFITAYTHSVFWYCISVIVWCFSTTWSNLPWRSYINAQIPYESSKAHHFCINATCYAIIAWTKISCTCQV